MKNKCLLNYSIELQKYSLAYTQLHKLIVIWFANQKMLLTLLKLIGMRSSLEILICSDLPNLSPSQNKYFLTRLFVNANHQKTKQHGRQAWIIEKAFVISFNFSISRSIHLIQTDTNQ
ncbi:hypothetical protein FGO68_gene1259 [Halteria grandinella]|uniref:Uncharacterized protein n=1 Tax=Halteria grandinella TaxID=5974 RepID=A0A8J8NPN5_HALGN|nr:hypothetical protein FGO68_gene1259 [Halteria grandinella]